MSYFCRRRKQRTRTCECHRYSRSCAPAPRRSDLCCAPGSIRKEKSNLRRTTHVLCREMVSLCHVSVFPLHSDPQLVCVPVCAVCAVYEAKGGRTLAETDPGEDILTTETQNCSERPLVMSNNIYSDPRDRRLIEVLLSLFGCKSDGLRNEYSAAMAYHLLDINTLPSCSGYAWAMPTRLKTSDSGMW